MINNVSSSYYTSYTDLYGSRRCCNVSSSTSQSSKSFVINHPLNESQYLVHVCLEGPENGVYYRGTGEIQNNEFTVVDLPNYVSTLAHNFSIQVTPIYNGNKSNTLQVSEIINNSFNVYGENTKFYWVVYGTRKDIDELKVEPNCEDVLLNAVGPYQWIENITHLG
jgi:hypothetical protein